MSVCISSPHEESNFMSFQPSFASSVRVSHSVGELSLFRRSRVLSFPPPPSHQIEAQSLDPEDFEKEEYPQGVVWGLQLKEMVSSLVK